MARTSLPIYNKIIKNKFVDFLENECKAKGTKSERVINMAYSLFRKLCPYEKRFRKDFVNFSAEEFSMAFYGPDPVFGKIRDHRRGQMVLMAKRYLDWAIAENHCRMYNELNYIKHPIHSFDYHVQDDSPVSNITANGFFSSIDDFILTIKSLFNQEDSDICPRVLYYLSWYGFSLEEIFNVKIADVGADPANLVINGRNIDNAEIASEIIRLSKLSFIIRENKSVLELAPTSYLIRQKVKGIVKMKITNGEFGNEPVRNSYASAVKQILYRRMANYRDNNLIKTDFDINTIRISRIMCDIYHIEQTTQLPLRDCVREGLIQNGFSIDKSDLTHWVQDYAHWKSVFDYE